MPASSLAANTRDEASPSAKQPLLDARRLSELVGFLLTVVGLLTVLSLTTTPMLRNPRVAAQMLISDNAIYTPEELYPKLGPESLWVLLQYNPLMWRPRKNPATPLLWLIPDADGAVLPVTQKRSAAFYGAETIHVPGAGHNLMMEANHEDLANQIHEWLVARGID